MLSEQLPHGYSLDSPGKVIHSKLYLPSKNYRVNVAIFFESLFFEDWIEPNKKSFFSELVNR